MDGYDDFISDRSAEQWLKLLNPEGREVRSKSGNDDNYSKEQLSVRNGNSGRERVRVIERSSPKSEGDSGLGDRGGVENNIGERDDDEIGTADAKRVSENELKSQREA